MARRSRKPKGRRRTKDLAGRRAFREAILRKCSAGKGLGYFICERCKRWCRKWEFDAHHRRGRNLLSSNEKWDPALGHGLCRECHGIVQRREDDWKEWMEAKGD
jgi:hypothetical protein